MTNQTRRIVLASTILIVSIALVILNPSILTTAQGQMYDKHPKKSSDVNIQKIKCVNSNVNVNGIDITQIPQDGTTERNDLQQANEQNPNGVNGNGLADRINVERNLVNVCVNVNLNDQVKLNAPQEPATTLKITKDVECTDLREDSLQDVSVQQEIDLCAELEALITADQFLIDVTGNNPIPPQFNGSTTGTVVTLGAGNYAIKDTDKPSVNQELAAWSVQHPELGVGQDFPTWTGECAPEANDQHTAFGTIAEGESNTCDIVNNLIIVNSDE